MDRFVFSCAMKCVHCTGFEFLNIIWGKKSHEITIMAGLVDYDSGFLFSSQLCFLLLIHSLLACFSGFILSSDILVPESPLFEDRDNKKTETESVSASSTCKFSCSSNKPNLQVAVV